METETDRVAVTSLPVGLRCVLEVLRHFPCFPDRKLAHGIFQETWLLPVGFPFGPELPVSFSASRVLVKTRHGQVVSAPAPSNQRLLCVADRALRSAAATLGP